MPAFLAPLLPYVPAAAAGLGAVGTRFLASPMGQRAIQAGGRLAGSAGQGLARAAAPITRGMLGAGRGIASPAGAMRGVAEMGQRDFGRGGDTSPFELAGDFASTFGVGPGSLASAGRRGPITALSGRGSRLREAANKQAEAAWQPRPDNVFWAKRPKTEGTFDDWIARDMRNPYRGSVDPADADPSAVIGTAKLAMDRMTMNAPELAQMAEWMSPFVRKRNERSRQPGLAGAAAGGP